MLWTLHFLEVYSVLLLLNALYQICLFPSLECRERGKLLCTLTLQSGCTGPLLAVNNCVNSQIKRTEQQLNLHGFFIWQEHAAYFVPLPLEEGAMEYYLESKRHYPERNCILFGAVLAVSSPLFTGMRATLLHWTGFLSNTDIEFTSSYLWLPLLTVIILFGRPCIIGYLPRIC